MDKLLPEPLVTHGPGLKHLERHPTPESRIARLVNKSHPSLADPLADLVMTEDFLAGPTGGSTPTPTTTPVAKPRPTTTTAPKPAPVHARPVVVPTALPAPTPAVTPPPVRLMPERVRIALEAEQLLEKALRIQIASGALSRAR